MDYLKFNSIKNKIFGDSVSIEVFIASVLFAISMLVNSTIIIINLLYFIIILEVTRMVVEYIKYPSHRVYIRYLVDAAIIASLREVIIIIVDSHNIEKNVNIIEIYFIITAVLMILRFVSMKLSPDEIELKREQK
jgi:uncharacterized membrane protein (DUF373 family)